MEKEYVAMPVKIKRQIEDLVDDSKKTYSYTETRYYIVKKDTGEILDDAQGYGYKTAQKAYAAYAYKIESKSTRKKTAKKSREIKKWMNEYEGFVSMMDECAFQIAKGSMAPEDKFNAKFVQNMLEEEGLTPNFTAAELLHTWKKAIR